MNILEELEQSYTNSNPNHIAEFIGNDPDRFAQLVAHFVHGKVRVTHHASHAINRCIHKHPHLIAPHLRNFTDLLATPINDTVKRNIVRTFQFIDLPEELLGDVFDNCAVLLNNPNEAVAIRAFSMTVLFNICRQYPELKEELKAMLLLAIENSDKPGILNRGRKTLKALDQL